jgi:hypothetical protein
LQKETAATARSNCTASHTGAHCADYRDALPDLGGRSGNVELARNRRDERDN